jgi:Mlc titration factor MtfA (ptsG expression regulator)
VATEAFFCTPGRLLVGKPSVYEALRDFYRQDPAHDRIDVGAGRPPVVHDPASSPDRGTTT